MSLELVVANPPKSTRRARKGKRKSSRRRARTRRAKTGVPVMAKKRKSSRRSSRRGGRRGKGGGKLSLIPSFATLKAAGASVGGYVAVNKGLEWLAKNNPTWFAPATPGGTPWMALGVKALIASGGGYMIGKFAGREMGQSFAMGGLTSVGLDLVAAFMRDRGQAGMGDGGDGYQEAYTPALAAGGQSAQFYANQGVGYVRT